MRKIPADMMVMLMMGQEKGLNPTLFDDRLLESGVRRIRNLTYLEGDERDFQRRRLDLYLPGSGSSHSLVVWMHGGGWRIGSKDDLFGLYGRIGADFAQHGIAWANINYRLTPRVQHPGHVEDCAAAVAFLLGQARTFNLNPHGMFLAGHSAGAHLAALLGLDNRFLRAHGIEARTVIRGIMASSGIYRLAEGAGAESAQANEEAGSQAAGELAKHPLGRQALAFPPEMRRDASPIEHVAPGSAPFLLVAEEFGFPDTQIQMKMMEGALRAAQIPVETLVLPGLNHVTMLGDMLREGNPTADAMRRFVARNLTA